MHTESESQRSPLPEVRGIHKAFVSNGLFADRRTVVTAQDVSFRLDPDPRAIDGRRVRCHLHDDDGARAPGAEKR